MGQFSITTNGTLTFVAGPPPSSILGITQTGNVSDVSYTTVIGGHYSLVSTNTLGAPVSQWPVVSGQWASEPIISNEQFPLGGTGGVRGYREGESYGDSGWHAQLNVRAPPINVGYFPYEHEHTK